MTTSEQLELEAEATRSRIAETLDELRGRMSPGQVVDQLVDYVREGGGGTFVRNFREQVVNNPVPVTLVGAGLAWLAMASRRPPNGGGGDLGIARTARAAGEYVTEAGQRLRDKAIAARDQAAAAAGQWSGSAREGASDTGQYASDAGDYMRDRAAAAGEQTAATAEGWTGSAREAANDWADQTRSAASGFGDRAGEAASAMNRTASAAYDTAAQASRRGAEMAGQAGSKLSDTISHGSRTITELFQDQPLVLAGIGLAVGALLGASLPGTEAEDRLMGEASDTTKSKAQGLAQQEIDKGKTAAQEAWNAASRELDPTTTGHDTDAGQSASPHFAEDASGQEVPLVPSDSDQSAVTQTANHGAGGDRETPEE